MIRSLIKQTAVKQAFFETVTLSLQNLQKIAPRTLMEALAQHSLEEADRMQSIRADVLQKLRLELRQNVERQ